MSDEREKALLILQEETVRRLRELAEWVVESRCKFNQKYATALEFDNPDLFSDMMYQIADDAGDSVRVLEMMADQLRLR